MSFSAKFSPLVSAFHFNILLFDTNENVTYLGCSEKQIFGAVQFLNNVMVGNTVPAKFEWIEQVSPLYRDVLHPGYKFFTRRSNLKPYMWDPLPELKESSPVTLAVRFVIVVMIAGMIVQ